MSKPHTAPTSIGVNIILNFIFDFITVRPILLPGVNLWVAFSLTGNVHVIVLR